MKKRSTLIALIAVAVVLAAGVAFAQGGCYLSPKTTTEISEPQVEATVVDPPSIVKEEAFVEEKAPAAVVDEQQPKKDETPAEKTPPEESTPHRIWIRRN